MSFRKVTSLTTLLSFILLILTSVILYITPQGKVAFWANWEFWGIGKENWGALHTNLGILFMVAGIIHTVLNWKPIMAYLKNRAKEFKLFTPDFTLALALTLVMTLLTLFSLPPVHAIQAFNETLKEAAAGKLGEPPYGHAEASTLKTFCQRTGINLKEAIKKLEKAGLEAVSERATLAEIAEANGQTPQQVYEIFQPEPPKDGEKEMPMKPGMGFGRKALAGVCATYGLDLQKTIAGLGGLGIEAAPEWSMKTIGEHNNMEAHSVFEAIRQLQEN